MNHPSSHPAFKELMAAIGFLMFQWSVLEHHLGEEIIRLRSNSGDLAPSRNRLRATPSERLAEWRALQSRRRRRDVEFQRAVDTVGERIQSLARLRNLVTHGFVNASADPESADEPWILCSSNISGVGPPDVRLVLSQLEDAIDQMEQCRQDLTRLGAD
jgi:hypothetical protein